MYTREDDPFPWESILKFGIRPRYTLRKLQHTLPLEHALDPQPAVYEGNPFIFVFWGT